MSFPSPQVMRGIELIKGAAIRRFPEIGLIVIELPEPARLAPTTLHAQHLDIRRPCLYRLHWWLRAPGQVLD